MADTQSVQDALDDLLAIKRSISGFHQTKESHMQDSAFRVNRLAQWIVLGLCLILIGLELGGDFLITRSYVSLNADPSFQQLGIAVIGIFLFICVGTLYFIIWKTAQDNQEDLSEYIQRHFKYLQSIAHTSDLFIKFLVVSAFILANKPEWIAPILFVFTADYLVQGRFFTLRHRVSMLLSILCFILAGVQFYLQIPTLLWPLMMFAFCTVLSMARLHQLKRIRE